MRYSFCCVALVGFLSGLCSAIDAPSCSQKQKCPESQPCCSAYGACGAGAYCLGGCDPLSSFSLKSCMPRATCKSADYRLDSLAGMAANTRYLGDATNINWVAEGVPVVYQDDSVLLTMAPNTVGTLLASTHYVWYGKISVVMRSSAGQGVVTAFIMMSDVKDEIDFEFVGADLQNVQSNYYWQGVPNYHHSKNLSAPNTNTQWHTYTIDWQQDSLTWSVDGQLMRTLRKKDTYDSKTGEYKYPQTPARIQLSLWPAGNPQSAKGTIDWAGGLIDWNSQYMANGYYYAQLKEVTVECAKPPSGAKIDGSDSYVYMDTSGLQSSVEITNDNTVLDSIYASGNNPNFTPKSKSKPSNVQVVPGISGGGARSDGSAGSGSGLGSGGSNTGSGHYASSLPGANQNGFSQGLHNNMAGLGLQAKAIASSGFAAVIAFGVLIAL